MGSAEVPEKIKIAENFLTLNFRIAVIEKEGL